MKKVLIVIPTLNQGGGQKFVMDLAHNIDKQRFDIQVLVYYAASNSIFDMWAKDNKISVVYLNKKVGLDFRFFKTLKKAVLQIHPDVVHTNLDCLLYLLPVLKKIKTKLHTVHTMAEREAVGLQKLVRKIAFKRYGVIPVAISDTVKESIASYYTIDEDKIPVVYNGVDCQRYASSRINNTGIPINFITVGNIYSVKNYSFMIDCFYEICKKYPNVSLTIVGDGEQRADIEKRIKEFGIEEKVFITGCVEDVENYLAKADIYLSTSIFEGLPISMLEAMAAGLPIIATDVGGVHDIVKDGQNGILVPFGDKGNYIEAMKKLILEETLREVFSNKAICLVQNYSIEKCVQGYENLYEKRIKARVLR